MTNVLDVKSASLEATHCFVDALLKKDPDNIISETSDLASFRARVDFLSSGWRDDRDKIRNDLIGLIMQEPASIDLTDPAAYSWSIDPTSKLVHLNEKKAAG